MKYTVYLLYVSELKLSSIPVNFLTSNHGNTLLTASVRLFFSKKYTYMSTTSLRFSKEKKEHGLSLGFGLRIIFFNFGVGRPDQEKILALLASWPFHQKPTAKCGNISIEKVLHIKKNRL